MLTDKSYFGFESPGVYQLGSDLVAKVYEAVKPYGPTAQICRAVNSICLEIAEGKDRGSDQDLLRLLYLATGLGFLKPESSRPLYEQTSVINGKIDTFIRRLEVASA